MYDLRHLINAVETVVENHNLGQPGAYRRWNWQPPVQVQHGSQDPAQLSGETRELGLNPYGCADAANLLYSIGRFPFERQGWIDRLQELQDPQSGLFEEATHHPIHTTAHCIAALELFEARPRYALTGLQTLRREPEMLDFLDALDWRSDPWRASHQGAGLYAALVLAGEVDQDWQDAYFGWLWEQADPQSGFWRKGAIAPIQIGPVETIFPFLAGSFHYLFNHEYAHRPLRYPQAMIDTCLDIFRHDIYPIGTRVGFAEIDWVYCLTRAVRQSGHRYAEVRQALLEMSERYIPFLLGLDPLTDDAFNDLHLLFGATCALAELQAALPGLIQTPRPLKLVLDRRPFI